jgi:hypothetical protein
MAGAPAAEDREDAMTLVHALHEPGAQLPAHGDACVHDLATRFVQSGPHVVVPESGMHARWPALEGMNLLWTFPLSRLRVSASSRCSLWNAPWEAAFAC